MEKPQPILVDMPPHIKTNIISQLSVLDRFALRMCSSTFKNSVDNTQELNFDKLFLLTNVHLFELVFQQNDDFMRMKYTERNGSVKVEKRVNGKLTSSFTIFQNLEEVSWTVLKALFSVNNLTIDHFVVANLAYGTSRRQGYISTHFTTNLETIMGNRTRRIKANHLGLFSSENNCHRLEFVLGAINLEVLSSMNIQVMDMHTLGYCYFEILTRGKSLNRLQIDDETSIGGSRRKSYYDFRTKLTKEELWNHILTTKLQTRNCKAKMAGVFNRLSDVDKTIPEGEGRRVKCALSTYFRDHTFQFQINQNVA